MSFFKGIFDELRSRRLWPVALVLVVALVAIPVLLSKSASSPSVAQLPSAGTPASLLPPVPGVTADTGPTHSRLIGAARDPFTQQKLAAAAATTVTAASGAATAVASSATGSSSTSGATGSTTTSSTTPSSGSVPVSTPGTPKSITPGATPTPAPAGLTSTQSYHVTLAITNPAGGLDTIDPLERLTVLPGSPQPLLVELGVLQGGNRVLFAVQPGTVVSGPGTCTPGPIDCEILSLGQDQTEQLSVQTASGVAGVALFAVTAITVDKHPSVSAANQARRTASAAGRSLLSRSTLSALSLFQYEPSLGVVVDLRNLTVGGG